MTSANNSRGFTLMEMVVVLAVIAILAAILTPIINSYIDRARFNAAQSDVKNIAAAIVQFNTDTRVWPIYTAPFTGIGGTKYSILTTDGNDAIDNTTSDDYETGTIGLLNDVLNQNTMQMTTSGASSCDSSMSRSSWGTPGATVNARGTRPRGRRSST